MEKRIREKVWEDGSLSTWERYAGGHIVLAQITMIRRYQMTEETENAIAKRGTAAVTSRSRYASRSRLR